MKSFKQHIEEGLRRTTRLYGAAIKQSRSEDLGKRTFDKIMGSNPLDRLMSDIVGREDPSTRTFAKADKGVLKMMSRAAAKPTGTDITSHVKNIYNAMSTGSGHMNMTGKMKKIRAAIDSMRSGNRGQDGSLIPEI